MASRSHRLLQLVDGLVYSVGISIVVFAVGAGVSLVRGGGWTTVRETAFVLGVLLAAVATLLTRPQPRFKRRNESPAEEFDEAGIPDSVPSVFQRRLAAAVPDAKPLAESELLSQGGRLFVTAAIVLIVTLGTEYW